MENKDNKNKKLKNRLTLTLLLVSAAFFVYALVSYIQENTLQPLPYSTPPAPTAAAATPIPTPDATIKPDATPTPTPSPTPYVKLAPVHIYFPDRELDMEVLPVEKDEEGRMDTVDSHLQAAWYSPGPAPGDPGNALINGHVRFKKKKGIFSILSELEINERVITEHEDGSTREFKVISVEVYPLDAVPDEVMDTERPGCMLTLITCHGDFDTSIGTSKERCVVTCVPVSN